MKLAAVFALVLTLLASRAASATPKESTRTAVTLALPFLAADVVYATRRGWSAPGWAIPEILHGSIYVSVMAANATDDIAGYHRAAWMWGILGAGMLIHGTLSLALWRLPGTEPAPRVSWRVAPGALVVEGVF